ncbi:MAG: aldo/keto reductase [Anaerolineae bacterium]|nr:aldo/keto reductase [Anaerolineae bacterium]
MEQRQLGRTGRDVGIIGLGTEHLEPGPEVLDRVLGMLVDAGGNYVDLLYVKPEYWETYGAVYRTHRANLVAAAHWGDGQRFDLDYCQACFDGMLAALGSGYAEVAMIAVIDTQEVWDGFVQQSLERLWRYQEQGRVGAIGMSGHDLSVALEAVQSGLIDVLMFPVNLVGYGNEGDAALYQACVEHDVGLVAMKAYHGGVLFTVDGRPSGITPAHCLSYVYSLPVAAAVPGPKNVDEMQATLRYLEATAEEKDYGPVVGDLPRLLHGKCVYCHHCLPCPVDIPVGWMMWLVDMTDRGTVEEARPIYESFHTDVSSCTECGECVARCPFGVDIMAGLRKVAELFG